jgi:ribosome-binding protein aMBF1 (putative translation factor)
VPKIEAAIKEVILRGARREIRLATHSLRRDVRRLRRHVGQLRQSVASLREVAAQWRRVYQAEGWGQQVSAEELKVARLSPRLIQKLRARLRLSQAGLAQLLKVSAAAVLGWERGRSEPSEPNRKGLVGLRKLRGGAVCGAGWRG